MSTTHASTVAAPGDQAAGPLPWWRPVARARARVQRWWQARLPATDSTRLTQANVYILPTRAGFMLLATLAVLLIACINYQLNLGYLLTFLLAGCAAAGMAVAHGNLRGLTLHLIAPPPQHAGQPASFGVELASDRRRERPAIGVGLLGSAEPAWADVPGQGRVTVRVAYTPATRGRHALPLLTVGTRYPLGTFRVWTVWRPAARLLVWPAPEVNPPALPPAEPRAGTGAAALARASGEFDGVRPYQRGDTMKLVLWKKWAKAGELVSRDTQHAERHELWLDFARCGALDTEARLSRLAAWVLAADRAGTDYGLRLPGQTIAPARGAAHRLACLEALALC